MCIVEVISVMKDRKYYVKNILSNYCTSSGKSLVQQWANTAIQAFFNFVSSRDLYSHK